ncbi:hypothetical protein SFHH103_04873 (plasmid) [Sinorhizobium fredii HH103]|uniref:Uncharacterized protein n=1 Tax=Sinorhizobium fredii (strain HH103) TaxID=1117943 RepID=G9AE57_SINF1|nr:hypothetical protein AB395_00004651 [Sinorhizobium fredii CCBAU 45436]CCE99339.1 hypothetical protein SFHH103_04873 [Sinorhizobium fredii HH103]
MGAKAQTIYLKWAVPPSQVLRDANSCYDSGPVVRPPIAWALAAVAAFVLDWF